MDPLSRSTEEGTSHGNEVLSEDLAHLILVKTMLPTEDVRNKIQEAIGPFLTLQHGMGSKSQGVVLR